MARNFNAHVPLDPIQDCVAVYHASGGEIDSDDLVALLRARNVPLALPVTHEKGPLSFRVYAEGTSLVPDAAGMLAPDKMRRPAGPASSFCRCWHLMRPVRGWGAAADTMTEHLRACEKNVICVQSA